MNEKVSSLGKGGPIWRMEDRNQGNHSENTTFVLTNSREKREPWRRREGGAGVVRLTCTTKGETYRASNSWSKGEK